MVLGSGISISGLGSGLDTASLIQSLVQLEGLRKAQLQRQQTGVQDKLGKFGDLKKLVETLQAKADKLSTSSKFLHLMGETSREGAVAVEVASTAIQGSHSITVQQLAALDRWAFDAVLDPTTDLSASSGQVAFTVGGQSYAIAIDAADSSLNDIASAINADAGEDVSASVVNAGTDAAPSWRLVLASKTSGVDGRIHGLSSTVTGLVIDGTEPAPGATAPVSANHLVVGLNAQALVDGLLVERTTNEFTGVLEGVTFTALAADPLNPVELTITPDTEAITTALEEFVTAYNAVINFVKGQNTYSEDGETGGPLFGDSSTRVVSASIHSSLFNVPLATVLADTEGFSTLGLVGLELTRDGTIQIDEAKLEGKITENVDLLADLFADDDGFDGGGLLPGDPGYGVDQTADSGLAATLVRAIKGLVDPGVGVGGIVLPSVFAAKEKSFRDQIRTLDQRIADEAYRLEQFEEQLRARFANLENLMGGLNSQLATLAAIGAQE
ncbi:MAG: flagellar filament capping protein FliD [Planctomycetota bacterium]